MFARVDANGDGKMSAEEWSNRNQQTFDDLFGRVDADKNGEISRDEWRKYREGGYSRAAQGGEGQGPSIWRYYHFVLG
jgi:IS1 family transposase